MKISNEKQVVLDTLDSFTRGYLECALWTTDNDDGNNMLNAGKTFADFSVRSLIDAKTVCEKFQKDNEEDLAVYFENWKDDFAGHDLWLSRNGHGAGFFDREIGNESVSKRLQERARGCGQQDVIAGDDGQLHLEGGH